jgi:hypothetical protein
MAESVENTFSIDKNSLFQNIKLDSSTKGAMSDAIGQLWHGKIFPQNTCILSNKIPDITAGFAGLDIANKGNRQQ